MGYIKSKFAIRNIGILIAVILSIPALQSLMQSGQTVSENRQLAPVPMAPQSIADLRGYTRQLDL